MSKVSACVPPRLTFIHSGIWIHGVIRTYPVAQFVLGVDPSDEQRAGSLCSDQKLFWMLLAVVVDPASHWYRSLQVRTRLASSPGNLMLNFFPSGGFVSKQLIRQQTTDTGATSADQRVVYAHRSIAADVHRRLLGSAIGRMGFRLIRSTQCIHSDVVGGCISIFA